MIADGRSVCDLCDVWQLRVGYEESYLLEIVGLVGQNEDKSAELAGGPDVDWGLLRLVPLLPVDFRFWENSSTKWENRTRGHIRQRNAAELRTRRLPSRYDGGAFLLTDEAIFARYPESPEVFRCDYWWAPALPVDEGSFAHYFRARMSNPSSFDVSVALTERLCMVGTAWLREMYTHFWMYRLPAAACGRLLEMPDSIASRMTGMRNLQDLRSLLRMHAEIP